MRLGKYMKPLAAVLCFAMMAMVSGTVNETCAAVSEEAPVPDVTAREELKAIIRQLDTESRADIREAVCLRSYTIAGEGAQELFFVAETLSKAGSVKCNIYEFNPEEVPELFALYDNKKLEVYLYTMDMVVSGEAVTPDFSMKNVTEVRAGKKADGSFTVKQVKGKRTTYTDCICKNDSFKIGKTCSSNGNKKAFSKFEKKYKKQKKLKMSPSKVTRDQLYIDPDIFCVDRDACIRTALFGQDLDKGSVVMLYDENPEPGAPSCRICGEVYDYYFFRVILGMDEKIDYDAFLARYVCIVNNFPLFGMLLQDNPKFIVTGFTPADGETPGYYSMMIDEDEPGIPDYYVKYYVETVNNVKRLTQVDIALSNGLVTNHITFAYGKDAWNENNINFTKSMDMVCFPSDKYLTNFSEEEIRSLKVNYPDRTEEIKALCVCKFIPFTSTGRFTINMKGVETDVSVPLFDSNEIDVLNPYSGYGYGFGTPYSELTLRDK